VPEDKAEELDQLTSSFGAAKNELNTLRYCLQESEKTQEELLEALAESRNAKEKLPLFEAKVKEISAENLELSQEVQGLREDIVEVRELYRTQLNILLEEKAALPTKVSGENEVI
jgi:predicted  nucleic acid-binding Zn-ribbon protein